MSQEYIPKILVAYSLFCLFGFGMGSYRVAQAVL